MTIKSPRAPRIREELLEEAEEGRFASEATCSQARAEGLVLLGDRVRLGLGELVLKRLRAPEARWLELVMSDARLEGCDLANAAWPESALDRVAFRRGRLTGFQAVEARWSDVVLEGARLDLAAFDRARLERCAFIDCDLTGATFRGARLDGVRFEGCRMRELDFSACSLRRCDLRGSTVEAWTIELEDLRGARADPAQAVAFAALIGLDLG